MKINIKQKSFVEEYLIDLNSTQAAIRAGYSKNRASEIGYQLLQKTTVQKYIQIRMKDREKRTEITQDMVLKEFAHIAFDDIKNYLNFYTDTEGNVRTIVKDSTTVDTRSIQEVSQGKDGQFKFKMYCKDNALLQIGKHLGMFADKVEMSGAIDVNNPFKDLTTEELKKLARCKDE